MPPEGKATPDYGRCQERVERTRCIFMDGHPGFHVCVGEFGSRVPIRGDGPVPDDEWVAPETAASAPSDGPQEAVRWDPAMVHRLLAEIREAGVQTAQDWVANLPRLRGHPADVRGRA